MTKNEELTRYMTQLEQYRNQIDNLEQQYSYMQAIIVDYHKAKMSLEKLGETEKNTDLLIPIGGGTFINVKANDPSKVLLDIGANVVMEKKYDEAIKKIDERIDTLEKNQENISSIIQQVQAESSRISAKAQELYQEMQQE